MDELKNKIEELEEKIEELTNEFRQRKEENDNEKEKVEFLIDRANKHAHNGHDKSTELYSSIELDAGSSLSIGGSGFFNTTLLPGESTETNYTLITAGNDVNGGLSSSTSGNTQINLQSAASTTGASFFYAFRPPLYRNTNQSITNGASTLQDGFFDWTVNILAGAYINLLSAAGTLLETRQIASNTADTITISGTWSSATASTYTYTVWETIYNGAANNPWERLYAMNDIRFGMGTSSGADVIYIKFGSGSPESAVTANVGSLYMRTDGGAGTTLYVKESGTGNTGWVGK